MTMIVWVVGACWHLERQHVRNENSSSAFAILPFQVEYSRKSDAP